MARKKSSRKGQTTSTASSPQGTSMSWVWLALVAGLVFGAVGGYFVGREAAAGATGVSDRYGRGPGHPHYMHNHP